MTNLTKAQREVLGVLSVREGSASNMGCSLGTLNALSLKGYIRISPTLGAFALPRNATWKITQAGRDALK